MPLPRLILAWAVLLLFSAFVTGCTAPLPREGGIPSAPATEIQATQPPPATTAPQVPPEPAGDGLAPVRQSRVLPEGDIPVPVPEPTPIAENFRTETLIQVTGEPWESFATWPQYPFEYRSLGYTIWVPYNTAAYEQVKRSLPARNEERARAFARLYTMSNDWWYLSLPLPGQEAYYRALISEPANDLPYDSILSHLQKIRVRYGLDNNEYAELIARFVQRAVPDREWENEGRLVERYPLETIGDLGGNRNDKSLLLAGLLAREGYGVALIYFPDANLGFPDTNRMLVGIQGDGMAAGYDGYLGIDPSTESFFGVYASQAAVVIPDVKYYTDYRVIRVSDGKRYTAGGELRVIWDRLVFMSFSDRLRDYTRDLRFAYQNRDDRHLVFEYMAYLGPFA